MDPASLVVAALVAGASAGLGETATSAVKDAYAGLKRLLQRAFESNPDAEHALRKAEENPEAYGPALALEVRASNAAADPDIVAAAEQLRAALEGAGVGSDVHHVEVRDQGQVGMVGPHGRVSMGTNQPHPPTP
jgi:hypothetical protein